MTFRITGEEFKRRMGFILLGFFSFYLVEPVRIWIETTVGINDFIIGGLGILATLYFFDF